MKLIFIMIKKLKKGYNYVALLILKPFLKEGYLMTYLFKGKSDIFLVVN